MEQPIPACLIIDDLPVTAVYWARLQQFAFGFQPDETSWGKNWRALEPARLITPAEVRRLAELLEEFGVRGKCTLLPCPAGLGRLDQSVRGYSAAELSELLAVMRDRIAPRMDITPEVLTHTMALDPATGGLLPHGETAWLSYLNAERQMDQLAAYLDHAFMILNNVGIRGHGLTLGGISDVSRIAEGTYLPHGVGREVLAEALLGVERRYNAALKDTFIFSGAPPLTEAGKQRRVPETVFSAPDGGRVFDVFAVGDILFDALHGRPTVAEVADAAISPDLRQGTLVTHIEDAGTLIFVTHSQTLKALNTGKGFESMREVLRRLRERYGARLQWMTTGELCANAGVA